MTRVYSAEQPDFDVELVFPAPLVVRAYIPPGAPSSSQVVQAVMGADGGAAAAELPGALLANSRSALKRLFSYAGKFSATSKECDILWAYIMTCAAHFQSYPDNWLYDEEFLALNLTT
jgi:hypothetical protein